VQHLHSWLNAVGLSLIAFSRNHPIPKGHSAVATAIKPPWYAGCFFEALLRLIAQGSHPMSVTFT
jgi:hypothetical protein